MYWWHITLNAVSLVNLVSPCFLHIFPGLRIWSILHWVRIRIEMAPDSGQLTCKVRQKKICIFCTTITMDWKIAFLQLCPKISAF
jgi:hypothetical protein